MPVGQKWPLLHCWQEVEFVDAVNVEAGQRVQLEAPALEKVALGQRVGLMEDKGQNEPAGQSTGEPGSQ